MWITSPLKSYGTSMDTQKNWNKILELIKDQISSVNFKGWFSKTKLEEITDTHISIKVPSAFYKNQIIARYNSIIKDASKKILGKDLELIITVDPSMDEKKAQEKNEEPDDEDFFSFSKIQVQPVINLNPKYTLKNFVVGPTNNLAYAAAQAVVQNPGSSYNPLFIYGPSGVGKTHLMQAIGNALTSKNPYLKLIYVSSERFTNDFAESIQNKKTGDFRQKYRSADIFLIDDVQFLSGKEQTQEEFFHTFNDLHTKNTQIILTSDRPPNEMQRLESRLVSRFQGGLMVDIQLPDLETRIAILKAKLTEKGESLGEEYLEIIAQSVDLNTRELEGRLIQILQMAKMDPGSLTVDAVKQKLNQYLRNQPKTSLDHKKVLAAILHYFNVKSVDIMGPRRQKELVLPRQIAMYIMYTDCQLSMEKIGQILGGRDHTTVLHGVDKIKVALVRDREVERLLSEVKQQLTI